jgi:CheY-like chemotaxis protein
MPDNEKTVLEFPSPSHAPSPDNELDKALLVADEHPDEDGPGPPPIRVLLLDDREENLVLRSAILRMHGYEAIACGSVHDAQKHLQNIDIAVLDYHLGAGKFGTEVANELRALRPEVPIIILSATLERRFGGVEDMHLLKGYSSVDDMINALRSFESKRRGKPVVVDARDFFYSRIQMAVGDNVVLEILDAQGNWVYLNDFGAQILGHERTWFRDHNMFEVLPDLAPDWREILENVALTRETYIDRTNRGLLNLPTQGEEWVWSIIAFPITLHDNRPGVVIMARTLERKSVL